MSIMQLTQTIHIVPSSQSRPMKRPMQPLLPGMELQVVEKPQQITNRQIAEVLANIADLLEFQKGNAYRIQAYRNATRGILAMSEQAADVIARGEALPVVGLGHRLYTRIVELVNGGTMTFHDGICLQTLPTDVRALMAVEHVGPITAIRLHEELGIDTIDKLWDAVEQHRIRQLPGFGVRSEERIKQAVEPLLKGRKHLPLPDVA